MLQSLQKRLALSSSRIFVFLTVSVVGESGADWDKKRK